jgi:hypothetical protein
MFINAAANHLHFATTTKDYTFTQNIFLNSQKGQKQTHTLSPLSSFISTSLFFFLSHFSIIIPQKENNQS